MTFSIYLNRRVFVMKWTDGLFKASMDVDAGFWTHCCLVRLHWICRLVCEFSVCLLRHLWTCRPRLFILASLDEQTGVWTPCLSELDSDKETSYTTINMRYIYIYRYVWYYYLICRRSLYISKPQWTCRLVLRPPCLLIKVSLDVQAVLCINCELRSNRTRRLVCTCSVY